MHKSFSKAAILSNRLVMGRLHSSSVDSLSSLSYFLDMGDIQTDIRLRFGIAVRKRRQELGISQEELAERAKLHRTYIGDIERGLRNLSLVNIEKVIQALDISIADFFTRYGVEGQ